MKINVLRQVYTMLAIVLHRDSSNEWNEMNTILERMDCYAMHFYTRTHRNQTNEFHIYISDLKTFTNGYFCGEIFK